MDSLKNWVRNNLNDVRAIMTIVIVGLAAVFIAILLIKAMNKFKASDIKGGVIDCCYAAGVAILAFMGIGGTQMFVKKYGPDNSVIPHGAIMYVVNSLTGSNGIPPLTMQDILQLMM